MRRRREVKAEIAREKAGEKENETNKEERVQKAERKRWRGGGQTADRKGPSVCIRKN